MKLGAPLSLIAASALAAMPSTARSSKPTKDVLLFAPAGAVGGQGPVEYAARTKLSNKCLNDLKGVPKDVRIDVYNGCGPDYHCDAAAIGRCAMPDDGQNAESEDIELFGHSEVAGGIGDAAYVAYIDVMLHCITIFMGEPAGKPVSRGSICQNGRCYRDYQMTCRVPKLPVVDDLRAEIGYGSIITDRTLPERYERIMKAHGVASRLYE